MKRQAGRGGNTARAAPNVFRYVSKTLSRNPHDSAVSLKQFDILQMQFLIKHKKLNLSGNSSTATHNLLMLPTKWMFLKLV